MNNDQSICIYKNLSISLKDIYALQILKTKCFSKMRSRNMYELNIVLVSGERVNLTYASELIYINDISYTLSKFIRAPIWDYTDY